MQPTIEQKTYRHSPANHEFSTKWSTIFHQKLKKKKTNKGCRKRRINRVINVWKQLNNLFKVLLQYWSKQVVESYWIYWLAAATSIYHEPPKLLVNFKFSTKSSLITISTCVFYFRYFYNSKLIEQRTWMPQGHFPPSFLLRIKFSWLFYHWYTIRNSFWCCDSLSYSFIRCFVHSFTMEANTMETATM